jgi:putative sterol carrier protein
MSAHPTDADPTEESPAARFFEELAQRSGDPLVAGVRGSVGFDLSRPEGRDLCRVRVDRGTITVEPAAPLATADAVVHGPGPVFDRMLTGEVNAMAAVLRGAIDVTGDIELVLRLVRLYSPPTDVTAEARAGA